MVNKDFQKELAEKVKEGIRPSHLKKSTSTPVKLSLPANNSPHPLEQVITRLEQQKEELLKINQEAVKQNEQLAQAITKLQQEKNELAKEKSELEEELLAKRLQLLKTPATTKSKPAFIPTPHQKSELEKNVLIIFLLITLSGALLLK
jgi:chromosome segregation ATPase